MNLHNIMEEEVLNRVEICYNDSTILDSTGAKCTCNQCKLDTTAYVLNRIKPRYIISERGIVHAVAEQGSQMDADINILIIEGMKKVHNLRRSSHAKKETTKETLEAAFNFPIFSGLVLDGNTFEPIKNAHVTLKMEHEIVEMFDNTWQNPYQINSATSGTFAFWTIQIPTNAVDEKRNFKFSIMIEAENYETTKYAFSLDITSNKIQNIVPQTASRYKLDDLYLFPIE